MRQSPTRSGDRFQELNDGVGLATLCGSALLPHAGGVATGRQLSLHGKPGGQTSEPVGARAQGLDPALKDCTSGGGFPDPSIQADQGMARVECDPFSHTCCRTTPDRPEEDEIFDEPFADDRHKQRKPSSSLPTALQRKLEQAIEDRPV